MEICQENQNPPIKWALHSETGERGTEAELRNVGQVRRRRQGL
jgi:hypothetical protein